VLPDILGLAPHLAHVPGEAHVATAYCARFRHAAPQSGIGLGSKVPELVDSNSTDGGAEEVGGDLPTLTFDHTAILEENSGWRKTNRAWARGE
jgi:hypothetical protein